VSDQTEIDDDDIEVIELETEDIPVEQPEPEVEPEADESKDERLAESDEDDDEDEDDNPRNLTKTQRKREYRKASRDRAKRELQLLREQNQLLMERVNSIEGSVRSQTEERLDSRLSEAQREVQTADAIIARAVEAGNGEDVVTAMRLKEEAQNKVLQLAAAKQQAAQPSHQGPDPRIASLAREWAAANPWFDASGRTEESAIALAIDRVLPNEGYDPRSVEYYEELTRRLNNRIGNPNPPERTQETTAKRKAPPQGTVSQHAPTSTRKQVYVTPERKQAMMDAGYWDDVALRNQMLKEYAAYDKSAS
jgi:hypothetical protein